MKKKIVFALIIGLVTTCIISLILLLVNTNFSGLKFLKIWLKSWSMAYLIIVPVILVISPKIEKLVNKFIKE
jgi:integral membrane sensor domain MASE1